MSDSSSYGVPRGDPIMLGIQKGSSASEPGLATALPGLPVLWSLVHLGTVVASASSAGKLKGKKSVMVNTPFYIKPARSLQPVNKDLI